MNGATIGAKPAIPLNERTTLIEIGKKALGWSKVKLFFKSQSERNEIYTNRGKEELIKRFKELTPTGEVAAKVNTEQLNAKISIFVNEILTPKDTIPNLAVVKQFYTVREELQKRIKDNPDHWLKEQVNKLDQLHYSEENANTLLRLMSLDYQYDTLTPELKRSFGAILEVVDLPQTLEKIEFERKNEDLQKKFEKPIRFHSALEYLKKQPAENVNTLFEIFEKQKENGQIGESKKLLSLLLNYPQLNILPKSENSAAFIDDLEGQLELWHKNLEAYKADGQFDEFVKTTPVGEQQPYPLTQKIEQFNSAALKDYLSEIDRDYDPIFEKGIQEEFKDPSLYFKSQHEAYASAEKLKEDLQQYKQLGLLDSFKAFYVQRGEPNLKEAMVAFNKKEWDDFSNKAQETWPELSTALNNFAPSLKDGQQHHLAVENYRLPIQIISLFLSNDSLRKDGKELSPIFSELTDLKDLPTQLKLEEKDLKLMSQYLRYGQSDPLLRVILLKLRSNDSTGIDEKLLETEKQDFETIDEMGQTFESLGLESYYTQQVKKRLDEAGEHFAEALSETAKFVEQPAIKGTATQLSEQKQRYQNVGMTTQFNDELTDQLRDKDLTPDHFNSASSFLTDAFESKYVTRLAESSGIPDTGVKQHIFEALSEIKTGEADIKAKYETIAQSFPAMKELRASMVGPEKLESGEFTRVIQNLGTPFWEDVTGLKKELNKALVEKKVKENWGEEPSILHDVVQEYLKTKEPKVLESPIEQSPFFNGDRRDQFALLFPFLKERYTPLDPEIIHTHLMQGEDTLPSKEILEQRVVELSTLKRFNVEFLDKVFDQADPALKMAFLKEMSAPYIIDCMKPGAKLESRALRLFGAYQNFTKSYPSYSPEAAAKAVRTILDDATKDLKRLPVEILEKVVPAPLFGIGQQTNESFNKEQTRRLNLLAMNIEAELFLKSKGLAYSQVYQKAVKDLYSLFKPEQINEKTHGYVLNVLKMGLELDIEHDPDKVFYFIKNDPRIKDPTSTTNFAEVKEDIAKRLTQQGSNLLTRLQNDPTEFLGKVFVAAASHLMDEKDKDQKLKKFSEALETIREPLQKSEIIQEKLKTAGPAAPLIRFAANMIDPSAKNVDMLFDQIGLAIDDDIRGLQKDKELGTEPQLSLFSAWILPSLVNQIVQAREMVQTGRVPRDINPLQEFLVYRLPEITSKLKWVDLGIKVASKAAPIASSIFETSLVQAGVKKLVQYGLKQLVESEAMAPYVGKEEKEAILGGADALVGVVAPILTGILKKQDLTQYTSLLRKIDDNVHGDTLNINDLNLCCLEIIQTLFTELRPIVVDVLKEIAQSELTPIG